jgi:hypothetical protein
LCWLGCAGWVVLAGFTVGFGWVARLGFRASAPMASSTCCGGAGRAIGFGGVSGSHSWLLRTCVIEYMQGELMLVLVPRMCADTLPPPAAAAAPARLPHLFPAPHQAKQEPNEFIVLNAAAYHAGYNMGFNCAEVSFGGLLVFSVVICKQQKGLQLEHAASAAVVVTLSSPAAPTGGPVCSGIAGGPAVCLIVV